MEIKYKQKEIDILVLGAGLAGLEAAFFARKSGQRVAVLSKGESASPGVIGFNANVSTEDTDEIFFSDIYNGGWELSDRSLISTLVRGSVQAVRDTEELGLTFDNEDGRKHLLKPLGCSFPRLVHNTNLTGLKTMKLLKKFLYENSVEFWDNTTAVRILKDKDSVSGVLALNPETEEILVISCKAVVLATGGGHFLKNSTYPLSHTGDGYAMAYEAGAELRDMEFIQFEPCRAVYPKPLGISTTILGKGGKITNSIGKRFMLDHFKSEGAVPKDVMSRLIAAEILEGRGTEHGGVYLDIRDLPENEIVENHSMYFKRFKAAGIDLRTDLVEVAPAAHSFMGGVSIDCDAGTGVNGLFAAGEVTGGIHGANRLGGNAGTETYVFGAIAGRSAAEYAAEKTNNCTVFSAESIFTNFDGNEPTVNKMEYLVDKKEEILSVMAKCMGPVRDKQTLTSGIANLKSISEKLESEIVSSYKEYALWFELKNIAFVSCLSARAALLREETRGVHYRKDFPEIDNGNWKKNIFFSKKTGISVREVR